MLPQWIIEKKRDGLALSEDDIRSFIDGYTDGSIPDYQMAAMAMAIYLNGMTFEETAILTDAMMRSGDLVNTSSIAKFKADKHSTGGIGDKVSLILAPLVASCDIAVPMISGRALGITGGTLDKMESIPGYRTDLTEAEFVKVIQRCGCSIIGQTADLAPADKKLYALRDVTATVPSIPLITASIMCKKLAEGIDGLVLDVKFGKGAFMKEAEQARALARNMVRVGSHMNKSVSALLTDMNQPLGRTVGNSLEVIESIEALRGDGPEDLMEVTYALSAEMLVMAGKADTVDIARDILVDKIASGEALDAFQKMIELHGGDASVIDDTGKLPTASYVEPILAETRGYIAQVNAGLIGRASCLLGAGRPRADSSIDPAVGFSAVRTVGDFVESGDVLLNLHANDTQPMPEVRKMVVEAITIDESKPRLPILILETIAAES